LTHFMAGPYPSQMARDWIADFIDKHAFEQLARELKPSQLHSVLLEITRARANARTAADILAQYQRDPFCRPALGDPRTNLAIDSELFTAAEQFEAIELSPVAPLGVCSTVAPTDQNRVLSALRSTEVAADPTNVLALECALRLRTNRQHPVHLVTSQRVIRAQAAPPGPGFTQHFRIFVLASGGIETVDHGFTVNSLVQQVQVLLAALDRLEKLGYAFGARRVEVLATPERQKLGDRVAERLGSLASRGPLDHAYYSGGLRFRLWATASDGAELALGDGGTFDWLSELAANRRAVFVASGLGAQLIPIRFRAPPRQGHAG
jgi:hypothetical protein